MATDEVKVKIQLQGGDEEDIEAPTDISGDDFMREVVTVLGLPTVDAGGHQITYRLDNKSTGRSLDGRRSIGENGVRQGHYLRLIRDVVAGSGRPGAVMDVRTRRLQAERIKLEELNRESDHVQVQWALPGAGLEPYVFEVTLDCKGIASVNAQREPVFAQQHRGRIQCSETFPSDAPKVTWLTPLFHPNVYATTQDVCISASEWLGGMMIYDLCRQLFEMVQYKNYHADSTTYPYPANAVAAAWVREVGEPRGIVDKRRHIFLDDQPFTRPLAARSRIRVGSSQSQAAGGNALAGPPALRIKRA